MDVIDDAREKRSVKPKRHSPASEEVIYAALDLGTNNCRLLIATPQNGGDGTSSLKILDSYSRIVRLGEGLSAKGTLSEDAMMRTLKALKTCKSKLQRFPKAKTRFVATEACRRASNAPAFLHQVAKELGMKIEIISNEEEANLAFLGCSSLLHPHSRAALTFDIGGGSTEFMWTRRSAPLSRPEVVGWNSIPYGVMNLSEQFGGAAFAEMYFDEIVGKIADCLRPFDERYAISASFRNAPETHQILSTSGTVTTLAAIHLNLSRYDRSKIDGLTLSMEELRGAINTLIAMSPQERYHHPCIGSHRADYIISGCAILEAIHRNWPLDRITIADRGVREGIIMGLLLNPHENEA